MQALEPMCFVDTRSLSLPEWRSPALVMPKAHVEGRNNDSLGKPIVIGNTMGLLYPGTASVGVLMLSAIGFEEMCLRTTWRTLAGEISAAGLPCLRFDYPGTGDALDVHDPKDIGDWLETVRLAAKVLREQSGCDRLVLVGQGLGGTLAGLLARELAPIEACVFMAPVINGKRYLRELSAWARMLTNRIGIESDPDDETGCAVAGLAFTAGRLAAIQKLSLLDLSEAPALRALLVGRENHAGEVSFVGQLEKLGAVVSRIDYVGIDNLMTDPTAATPPKETIANIVAWLRDTVGEDSASASVQKAGQKVSQRLLGEHFVERPVRFGEGGRLFGVLCQPLGDIDGPTVVFVNAGRDYHIGWGRVTIAQARAFAAQGIASFRFDIGGIGDSHPLEADGGEILYSDQQVLDVCAAVDYIVGQGFRHPILVGRCSGAYAAFNAAVADERVKELVMINIERFVWDPDENVDDALRYGHRSVSDLGATLRRPGGLMRLLSGKLRVAAVTRYLTFRAIKQASIALAPYLKGLTKQGRLYEEAHRRMRVLTARGVATSFVFTENDIGLVEFNRYFHLSGSKIARYPQVGFNMVPDADHNFTHKGARDRLLIALRKIICI